MFSSNRKQNTIDSADVSTSIQLTDVKVINQSVNMANTLPSPPATRESTPLVQDDTINKDDLGCRLDNLLEQYLEALDEYTTLREELSKSFAAGFMALANAQRTTNLGPGRRYGQDGYDSRMKATKRVRIVGYRSDRSSKIGSRESRSVSTMTATTVVSQPMLEQQHEINIIPYGQDSRMKVEVENEKSATVTTEAVIRVPKSSAKLNQQPGDATSEKSDGQPKKSKPDPAYRDPATWYSILVPPALRQAQSSFSKSVDTSIPQVLSAVALLKTLESQIQTLRDRLGVQHDSPAEDMADLIDETSRVDLSN